MHWGLLCYMKTQSLGKKVVLHHGKDCEEIKPHTELVQTIMKTQL